MTTWPTTSDITADDLRPAEGVRGRQLAAIRASLTDAGLQAYLAFTPSNVHYVSGYESYFLANWWRMHGKIFAAVSAREDSAPALVLGDAEDTGALETSGVEVYAYPMWVEPATLAVIQDPTRSPDDRPAQWSEEAIDEQLRRLLAAYGIRSGRVGVDLAHMTLDAYRRLCRVAPEVEWVDFTDAMYRIRAVKHDYEIARLQAATELADAGMTQAVAAAHDGASRATIHSGFVEGIARRACEDPRFAGFSTFWVLPAFGSAAGINADQDHGLRPGDLLKFDCGTTVLGYRSDHGRTFAYGEPSAHAKELYGVLKSAHDAALAAIVPGVAACEVFAAAEERVRSHGYPGYNRGHFGHSVGMDTFHEEPPFLSRHESEPLRAGMVLAVETPFYGDDLGSIMIEDLVLVTDGGARLLSRLSRELEQVTPRG